MPQFCILFYSNYTILATQRGGHGTMAPPLNTPLTNLVYREVTRQSMHVIQMLGLSYDVELS